MSGVTHLIIKHDSSLAVAGVLDKLHSASADAQDPREFAKAIVKYFSGLGSGTEAAASVEVITADVSSPAKATTRVTITHANVTAGDTLSVGGVIFTARASASLTNEWTIGADASADANALSNVINSSALYPFISAVANSSGAGNVDLTFNLVGPIGNLVSMTTSDATAFGLAAANFGSGTGGTSGGTPASGVRKVYNFGTAAT